MDSRALQLLVAHRGFLAVLLFATAIHLPIYGDGLNFDGCVAMAVAQALVEHGTFEVDTTLVPHHPPGMAMVFLPFGVALGFTEASIHTLELVFLGLDLLLLYFMARGLGPRFALVPMVLLSLDPVLYLNMSEGRSLSVLIFFSLTTLWGIWKGLEESRWLALAAVSASMGFLTADAIGYLFLFAGAAGFLWRFYYHRWKVLRDRGYLAAIAIFGSVVVSWTSYNWITLGTPVTDPRTSIYLNHFFFDTPLQSAIIMVGGFVVFFLLYVGHTAVPFLAFREGRHSLRALPGRAFADQRIGAMVLFIAVVVSISALMASTFSLWEPGRPLSTADTYLRYVATVAPITYLAVGMHVRVLASMGKHLRWVAPLVLAILMLTAQLTPKYAQGDRNGAYFEDLAKELEARGYTTVYTEGAIALRYNVPGVTFITVDKGYSTPSVNITTDDVPRGAHMVTNLYVPKAYDGKFRNLFLIDHFDPDVNSPFVNSYYVH